MEEKTNETKAEAFSSAEDVSIGSQTDHMGGINPETSEFLKGLWR